MTDLIDGRPEIAAIDARLADVDERKARYLQWAAEQGAAHQEALAGWRRKVDEAIDRGKPPPPRPPEPEIDHADRAAAFKHEQDLLERDRQAAIIAAGPMIEADAQQRYAEAIDQARAHVDALAGLVDTVRGSQQAVRQVAAARNAADAADPAKGSRVLDPSVAVDVAGLVDAVERGTDLLSVRVTSSAGYVTGGRFWDGEPDEKPDEPPPPRIPGRAKEL